MPAHHTLEEYLDEDLKSAGTPGTVDLTPRPRAVAEYAPSVDSILRARSRAIRHIEQTLDGLLDFCFDLDPKQA
jgi:hypothetical protein